MSKRGNRKKKDLKRAARALRLSRQKRVRERRWDQAIEDEDHDAAGAREGKMRRPREDQPSSTVERLIEESGPSGAAAEGEPVGTGMVVGIRRRACQVLLGDEQMECLVPTELAVFQQTALAVGDRVDVIRRDDRLMVAGIGTRKTKLSRPDPHIPGVERIIAANVDLAVVVASAAQPSYNERVVDRCLVAVAAGEADAALCVNKIDLVDHAPEQVQGHRDAGVRVVLTSCVDGRGVADLSEVMRGKLCVMVGPSGVGKSSLLNVIDPGLSLLTKPVRERDGRGRHTTTFSELYQLKNGTRVIDTPGIRELGLYWLKAEDLAFYFPEFQRLPACRFRNCSHTHEPGCSVKAAVEGGDVAHARYESYVRIYDTLDNPS